MNGPQDLGGAQGFGPLPLEVDEPHFHAPWERRAFALTLAMGATGQWNLDQARAARESLPPAVYLSSGYYRIWFEALERLLEARGLGASGSAVRPARVLRAADVPAVLARGGPTERPSTVPARYAPGEAVRTCLMHPAGHTRLPRYIRGRPGRIEAVRGVHVFPDTHAAGQGEQPCWLYTVRFEARDLWGPDTSASSVHVDCWEPYLEPAPGL
jgi:nitrile hydratase beta subunit